VHMHHGMNILTLFTTVQAGKNNDHGGVVTRHGRWARSLEHPQLHRLDLGVHIPFEEKSTHRNRTHGHKAARLAGKVVKGRHAKKQVASGWTPAVRVVKKAKKTCRFGMVLEGDVCVRPEPVCDTFCDQGFFSVGDMCVAWRNKDFEYTCDDERSVYVDGGFCLHGEKTTPIATCQTGWELHDGMCAKKSWSPCGYECPEDYFFDGTQCVMEVEKMHECPVGFVEVDGICTMHMTRAAEPEPECPKDCINFRGKVLSREEPTTYDASTCELVCEEGGDLDEEEKVCFEEESEESEESEECDYADDEMAGHHHRGSGRTIISAATKYYQYANHCVQERGEVHMRTTKSVRKCPPGSKTVLGKCYVPFSKAEPTCAAGFELEGNKCVKELIRPCGERCPSGYMMQGTECIKLVKTPATKKCPYGYRLNDRLMVPTCVKKVIREPITQCQEPKIAAWEHPTWDCACEHNSCSSDETGNCVTYE